MPNEEPIQEKYENDSQNESDEKNRRDYRTCRYAKPIKDLLRLLFSLRTNRKYIPEDINVELLSVRRISKRELKKAIDIISQIYRILTSSNKSTPDSECASQVQKLSKAFLDVIPFKQSNFQINEVVLIIVIASTNPKRHPKTQKSCAGARIAVRAESVSEYDACINGYSFELLTCV